MIEPAELFRYLVKSLLKHHSLSNDQNHVTADEKFTSEGRVKPLFATVCAAKEIASVNEDAAPDLNGNIYKSEYSLETEIDVHLLAEHFLGKVTSALLVSPVQVLFQFAHIS